MTRAKETLCLFDWAGVKNPHLSLINGDFLLERTPIVAALPSEKILGLHYEILGMKELFLDYAGQHETDDPIHDDLAQLNHGDVLYAQRSHRGIGLYNTQGHCVAPMSKRGRNEWIDRLGRIEKITVLAMVQRRIEDSGKDYLQTM